MKRQLVLVWAFSLLLYVPVQAQSTPDRDAWGYIGGGLGAAVNGGSDSTGFFQVMGGGEGLLAGGFGAAADIGYVAPFEAAGDGFGAFSPGVSYHFGRDKTVDPFLTGGYTLFFRNGTAHGFHFGGGIDWWGKGRLGLRIEGRDAVMENEVHFVSLRVSLLAQ